ncbi:MAG: NAD-dependent epimerase/dehydratase family protein [Deltaproteobacteria bacterium]|nr:NAD-dependent epimerase/dehydratase family protein [Deltaproteobacteria bacterium]
MRILLTGSSGRLGRRVALKLHRNHYVVGIDSRPPNCFPIEIENHQIDLRRRTAENILKEGKFDAVMHMGVTHNFRFSNEEHYTRNIFSTEKLLQLIVKYHIKKLVLLSSGDVYGPIATNSHFIDEDAPLMASQSSTGMRTLVAVDRAVQSFFWRHNEIETVILRPCHIVGPHVRNAASKYLRLNIVPTLMGYDPMLQLISEEDLLPLVENALMPGVRGVFNLAGTEPVPLHYILKILNKPTLPLPYVVLKTFLEHAFKSRMVSFAPPELDHIRFNAVLDTRRSQEVLGAKITRFLEKILKPFKAGSLYPGSS